MNMTVKQKIYFVGFATLNSALAFHHVPPSAAVITDGIM
jgi:hypothetical protein